MSFSQLFFTRSADGASFSITSAGKILCVVLLLLVLSVVSVISGKKSPKRSPKRLVYSSAALALGYLLSFLQPYKLPWGGSVTLFSMLFVCLIGYWYGLSAGLCAGFAFSLLQFLQDGGSFILSPLQLCCDYFFAFTALGLSGVCSKMKNGLAKGYLLAVFVRGLFHSVGAYFFWMDYMPDSFPKNLAMLYPIIYNYSYLLIEAVATLVLIRIPAVKKALAKIREDALS